MEKVTAREGGGIKANSVVFVCVFFVKAHTQGMKKKDGSVNYIKDEIHFCLSKIHR